MKNNALKLENLAVSHTSREDLWKTILREQSVRTMAEIGVWKGDFSAFILSNVQQIETYYMVDPWQKLSDWNKPFNVEPEVFDQVYNEMVDKTSFAADKLRILKGRTKNAVNTIPDESLDFAYIDGDHTLRGITIDLIKILPKIKTGGFIGGDDLVPTPWQHDARFEPTLVFPYCVYFAEAMDLPISALGHNQFLIEKNEKVGFSFNDLTGSFKDLSLGKLFCPPKQ